MIRNMRWFGVVGVVLAMIFAAPVRAEEKPAAALTPEAAKAQADFQAKFEEYKAAARDVEGVVALHDVHVWSIAPSFPALSAHVELKDVNCTEHILTDLASLFRERFGIGHVTLQPETPALHEAMECCLSPDASLFQDEHAHLPASPR